MIDGAFALAFAAGMVATFNPCGFAMLPAYLAYFLGLDDESSDTPAAVLQGLKVSGVLTLGFVLVFGVAGFVLTAASGIQEHLSWVTMVIGLLLIVLGFAFLFGFEPSIALPRLERGAGDRQLGSMLVFGVSYAVASLSCTIAPFLAVTGGMFGRSDQSFLSGLLVYVTYALGMGLVLGVLTMAVALARQGLVTALRGAMPYVHRFSGALLILAGLYMSWYGYWESRVFDGDSTGGGPAQLFFDLNSDLNNWVQEVGATRIGLVLAGMVAVTLLLLWGWRASNRSAPAD